jgi:hypothetical protein
VIIAIGDILNVFQQHIKIEDAALFSQQALKRGNYAIFTRMGWANWLRLHWKTPLAKLQAVLDHALVT